MPTDSLAAALSRYFARAVADFLAEQSVALLMRDFGAAFEPRPVRRIVLDFTHEGGDPHAVTDGEVD